MIHGGAGRSLPRAGMRFFASGIAHRPLVRGYHSAPPNPPGSRFPLLARRIFTWGTIGANAYVFLMWNTSKPSSRDDPDSPRQARLRRDLMENWTLSQKNLREGRYWTLLTSAFSHRDAGHLLLNMFAFTFVSGLGFSSGLGAARMVVLALGSAVASSASSMLDETTRTGAGGGGSSPGHAHLGASGMVEGLLVALTLMRPRVPVYVMFVPVAIPLWVAAGAFVAWDYYHLVRERQRGPTPGWMGSYVGYSAHLGGAAFGAAYYLLRLRYRFGGVLPPRRL